MTLSLSQYPTLPLLQYAGNGRKRVQLFDPNSRHSDDILETFLGTHFQLMDSYDFLDKKEKMKVSGIQKFRTLLLKNSDIL